MEKFIALPDNSTEVNKCETCDKVYKRKAYLTRHKLLKHETNQLIKLKIENENLVLKINLLMDQIIFLKRLILIQEHTTHSNGRPNIRSNDIDQPNNTDNLPLTEFTPNMFTKT